MQARRARWLDGLAFAFGVSITLSLISQHARSMRTASLRET
jgi:hypothetical protein